MPITPRQVRDQLRAFGVDTGWSVAIFCTSLSTRPTLQIEYMASGTFEETHVAPVANMMERCIAEYRNRYQFVFIFDINELFVLRGGHGDASLNNVSESVVGLLRALRKENHVVARHMHDFFHLYPIYYCSGESLIPCSDSERASIFVRACTP